MWRKAQGGNIIMEKIIKVGQMPGRIVEVAVEVGSTVGQVLEIAGLDATGYQIKMDGATVTTESNVTESTQLILLAKLVKGNSTVKIGVMPGRVSEFAVDSTTTYNELFTLAEVNPDGYEVKADGVKVTDFNTQIGSVSLVLLAKQIKGNTERLIKIGQMPGRISEIAIDSEATIGQAVELAELSADGYQIKADGNAVTLDDKVGNYNLILLAKMVKGNKNR